MIGTCKSFVSNRFVVVMNTYIAEYFQTYAIFRIVDLNTKKLLSHLIFKHRVLYIILTQYTQKFIQHPFTLIIIDTRRSQRHRCRRSAIIFDPTIEIGVTIFN
ncbi:hypothetical protein ASF60_22295 [Methylobacterium sp. Leaf113]|nr:hypothetical protein ASF60_22295 [Methylobacterium sp. Leaf113]